MPKDTCRHGCLNVKGVSMDIDAIIKQLTREEKAALVAGVDFMYTNPVPRLNIY